jgi:hypothetical protein
VIGDSIEEFVTVFTRRLDELAGILGWPFSATNSFGELLNDIFILVSNSRVKLRCLEAIWDIGYERDQWAVQDIMKKILGNSSIPKEIYTPFAVHIMKSTASLSLDMFSHINVPEVIKKALIKKTQ